MNEVWWRANGSRVKARLTRAERSDNPALMERVAAEVEALMDEHGYPDWWSRIERLRMDAAGLRMRRF